MKGIYEQLKAIKEYNFTVDELKQWLYCEGHIEFPGRELDLSLQEEIQEYIQIAKDLEGKIKANQYMLDLVMSRVEYLLSRELGKVFVKDWEKALKL